MATPVLNLTNWVDRFLVPLDDPGSRLFHWNLMIALGFVAAWIWVMIPRGQRGAAWRRMVFRRSYWWNRSTRVDYQFYLLNSALKVFLFIPFLDFSYQIAGWTARGLEGLAGGFPRWPAELSAMLIFTAAVFAWDDLLRFSQHLAMHKIPFLWRIHAVHHSARVLTPITLFRNHPLESAIATVRNSISLGVATGTFVFLFDSSFSLVTLLGVNVFGFMFNLLGANLRHSHVPISFGKAIESIFISPRQHQIHHSRASAHQDRNLGVSLSVWDRLLGTLTYSHEAGRLRMGIRGEGTSSLANELARVYRRPS